MQKKTAFQMKQQQIRKRNTHTHINEKAQKVQSEMWVWIKLRSVVGVHGLRIGVCDKGEKLNQNENQWKKKSTIKKI